MPPTASCGYSFCCACFCYYSEFKSYEMPFSYLISKNNIGACDGCRGRVHSFHLLFLSPCLSVFKAEDTSLATHGQFHSNYIILKH